MDTSVDEVIDGIFELFGKFANAASLGTKQLVINDNGVHHVSIDSYFIPVESGNEGYMVSRLVHLGPVPLGMPSKGISYSNIAGLDHIRSQQDIARLYQTHITPPGKEKTGIVKAYGTLFHCGYRQVPAEVSEHQVKPVRFDIDAPFNVIVINGLNLDPRFNKVKVLEEARYGPQAPMRCFGLVLDDLKVLPKYTL